MLAVWPFSPETSRALGPLDKLLHLCEYLLFAWCLVQTGMASGLRRTRACAMAFVVSVGYGALLEGVQAWLPYRRAEWGDLMADTAGAGLGFLLGYVRMGS
ncbi:MAG: VanZ family protein [Candidatus Omnitrophica bacterium]|nr:VanZ family protein [Candidatus Omnitrophota bacterium]